MTVERGQQTASVDLHASVRTELLAQIVVAQATLASAIAELSQAGGNPGPLAESRSNMALLGELGLQLGTANSCALTSLRSEVAAAVATASSTAQQARTAATSAASAVSTDIAQLANASREQVNNVMRCMKDFDPYLQFDSKAEEEAYRKREEERNQYIANQQAKNTPEGNLNAAGAAVGQMADAKAHGAGDSPEFEGRWKSLVETTESLRNTMRAQGHSTEEFDKHLRDDLRSIMKSKGLTDAQIDERFAKNPDPLEAAKAYVGNDDDLQKISRATNAANSETGAVGLVAAQKDTHSSMSSAIAALQAAGVTTSPQPVSGSVEHGVSANDRPVSQQGRLV
jgi:hypothetical protein